MKCVLENSVKSKIEKEMANYAPDQIELYLAEAGWQDWMEDYTDSADGEPITEAESKAIATLQRKVWAEVHGCHRCGSLVVSAGTSNEIDGRLYHGNNADVEWVVCPECYEQDDKGNWHYKG